MIEAKNLVKQFGTFTAVDGVDLVVNRGECLGLLGPNGAGKSTVINMLYGAALRTSGSLKVFGLDPTPDSRSIKKRLGVVTQENALDESLTVIENMLLYSSFVGLPKKGRTERVMELLEYMNLAHKKDARIQTLSGGMRRRLVFVRALLGKPELVILDEPTTGLDPAVRHLLWGKVKELRDQGTTILLTTHYMHEAEILCDRVSIMNKGKIVTEGTPRSLIQSHTPGFVGVFTPEPEVGEKLERVIGANPTMTISKDSSGFYLRTKTLEELAGLHHGHSLEPLQIRPANLEDVFLKTTGEGLATDD
jgi:lipooligosaccharide transport system ATP-binding protein